LTERTTRRHPQHRQAPGANAIAVADEVLRKVERLKGRSFPPTWSHHHPQLRRDRGGEIQRTAAAHGHRRVGVALLIWLTLGWRESASSRRHSGHARAHAAGLLPLRLHAEPHHALRADLLIGILVDDAIVVVENIVRHFHLPQNKGRNWSTIAVEAVGEVGNPTILATFAVIAAVLPMAFVGGLMGPYMRPIPIGASAAMFWSLLIAFIVTPWASIRILRWGESTEAHRRHARRRPTPNIGPRHPNIPRISSPALPPVMGPLIAHRLALGVSRGITAAAAGAMATVGIGWVKVKMLPFDNKSEFQIILNMPEGSALERTAAPPAKSPPPSAPNRR
jgi:hypothetical protein